MPSSRLSPLALALCPCSSPAFASGFALLEQSASGLGASYAGEAAKAEDASAVHHNPAGLPLLSARELSVSAHLISPRFSFSGSASPDLGGGPGGDAGPFALVPSAFFSARLNDSLSAGFGLHSPFGLKTEYDASWMGRTHAIESSLAAISLTSALGWRLDDSLSLGASVSLSRAEALLSRFAGPAGVASLEGDSLSAGYALGALWRPTPSSRYGLAYHGEIRHELDGALSLSALPGSTPASAELTLPDSLSLSGLWALSDRLDLLADATWTGWSDFSELRVLSSSGSLLELVPHRWEDSWRYSFGARYRLLPGLRLQAGAAYDESPVNDAFRTARIPDSDRVWLSAGASFDLGARSSLDLGYAHLFVRDASLEQTSGSVSLSGEYSSSVDLLGAQYSLRW